MPLKHLSNFWRTLDMPFINCELSLTLTWSKNCVLTDMITRAAGGVSLPAIAAPALSVENDNKLLEQLKTRF